jgi:hypothetical protein
MTRQEKPFMLKSLAPALALLLAANFSASAAEVKSGLKDGAHVDAFIVRDCTGPSKGESLCYRCKYAARPVVAIFTRTLDANVTNLIKNIDQQVGKNSDKNMRAFVVLLTDDPDAAQPKLVELAKKNKIKNVPLTIFDGIAGPPAYKLQKGAEVTVLMWKKHVVKANFGFAKGKLDKKSVKTVATDTKKILD